jgi:hypothetical protein
MGSEMMNRFLRLAAVSGSLAVAMVIVSPSVASASGSICAESCAAQVDFQSYGEVFTVHDYAEDGHGTYGAIQVYKDGYWHDKAVVYNRNGYAGPPEVRNLDIVDGRSVRYIACFLENGVPVRCGYWKNDQA